jgi:hypothetical protein
METIKNLIEFLNSYPVWAKLFAFSGLLITVGTLIFVPRVTKKEDTDKDKPSRVYLKIQGVKIFPSNDYGEIQIDAFVNGTKFRYPSVAGVEWLEVGPTMSPGIFEVPDSDIYEVRFEGRMRGSYRNLASQQILRIIKLPYTNEYNLHQVEQAMRSAAITARVRFSIERE